MSAARFLDPDSAAPARTSVEAFSAVMFGRKKRLELAAFLAESYSNGQAFCAADVAERTDMRISDVWSEIAAFERVEIVEYVGAPRGGKPRYYQLRDSAFWTLGPALLAELTPLAGGRLDAAGAPEAPDRRDDGTS